MAVRMWLPVAAEATWYSWRQIIPSGGTLYHPVAMVTSQGQVLTQALPPGTIQIQNSQVKLSDWWCFGRHIRCFPVPSPPTLNLLLWKGPLYIWQKPPPGCPVIVSLWTQPPADRQNGNCLFPWCSGCLHDPDPTLKSCKDMQLRLTSFILKYFIIILSLT